MSRRNACGPVGTPACSDARCRSTWGPPSWSGPARSPARDASTRRCSTPPEGKLIARHVGRDTVVRVIDAHFATSTEQFRAENERAAGRAGADDHLRRFTYNPLRGHPLLTGFGPGYLCPMPQLAWAKATPWGVYFTGLGHHGDRFARDLGHLFEQYIGRQLRLLAGAQVLPEITYSSRTGSRKTVDWIVVLPEVVLLVEVKSAIPTEPVRLGTPDAAGAMLGKIGKAFTQIDVTAQLIADRDPALAAVPAGRPVLGLAVTLEPFHVATRRSACCPPLARRSPSRPRPRSRSWSRSPARRRAASCLSERPTGCVPRGPSTPC